MGNSRSKPTKLQSKMGACIGKTSAEKKNASVINKVPSKRASQEFIEKLFEDVGTESDYHTGDKIIDQGSASARMYFIKEGQVDLVVESESGTLELARRGAGDVIGELSVLLGTKSSAAAVAVGSVKVIAVEQTMLLEQLKQKPLVAGQLFKVIATYLSERISDLSGVMRSNVVKAQAPRNQQGHGLSAAYITKARSMFGLSSEAKLMGIYQCSVRREVNAIKEANSHFGEMYVFDAHLAFDLKMFAFHKQMVIDMADVVAFLKSNQDAKCLEVQSKGQSLELLIDEGFEEAASIMEACRVKAKTATLQGTSPRDSKDPEIAESKLEDYNHMVEPLIMSSDKGTGLVDLNLKEEDWAQFLSVSTQRTYRKGEYVVREGQATATLFQIISGTLRVELQLADQAQAVVVGYRKAGEMMGETSLLKEGRATASLAADCDTVVVCIEGRALEQLFSTEPGLPSRFFCFLASYQGDRLYNLTESFAARQSPTVTIATHLRLDIETVMGNPAFCGVYRKYLAKTVEDSSEARDQLSINAFDFFVYAADYKNIPERADLTNTAVALSERFFTGGSSYWIGQLITPEALASISAAVQELKMDGLSTQDARQIFIKAQQEVLKDLEKDSFELFLGSSHYRYILELKAKEDKVPTVDEFKVVRVLGEGGFGQVIDVIKRDCGCHYAMKVMQKEAMKQNLGSSWRKKIASEQHIMSILQHPFLVNLKYAFQNPEFLILVMDMVPGGDLSEFVLTKRRLTPEQVNWVIMETVEVLDYIHQCSILYRDLKPENLLIDHEGHVRLIDMGLAARLTDRQPLRNSRVGTDCYMAPEVRWSRRRRQPYGFSADWYTVGVLLYEFTHGALPFTNRDSDKPTYRGGDFPSPECQQLCELLLQQDWRKRLGSGPDGALEIKEHPYFEGIEWEIVAACKLPSPMKGVKGQPRRKRDKEIQAQRTAGDIVEAERAEVNEAHNQEYNISTWDFVSPTAITDEYMESMYQCVSSI